MPKPNVLAVETAVTDLIYKGGNETLKQQFFDALPALLDAMPDYRGLLKAAPRPGENILLPAEAFDAALLQFGVQHGLAKSSDIAEDNRHWVDAIATELFGTARLQAGGSLANSFDAMVHSTLSGQKLIDGTFLTAVGDDAEGRKFEESLAGHIHATRGGRQFTAHIIPTGKDRIIIATPSSRTPCDTYLDPSKLQDPALLNADTDMVMLGGYLFYTPHFEAIFETALTRIEALNKERAEQGKMPIKLVLTCAAQGIAAHPEFRTMVQKAVCITDTIIHANTGEFRRLLDRDTDWREPFEEAWAGLEGGALEAAKQANQAYQDAKMKANQVAIRAAETVANLQARPDGALPGHRRTNVQFVVTNGSKGTFVVDANGYREYPVAKVDRSKIVNTVGAGDNFAGGFELGVALGKSEAECIQLAGAFAGAVICQDPPRLAATATHDIAPGIKTGGALATLTDSPASRALLERLKGTAEHPHTGMEIEKKFLITSDGWKHYATTPPIHIVQSYFPNSAEGKVTIRYEEQLGNKHALHFQQLPGGKALTLFIPKERWDEMSPEGTQALFGVDGNMTIGKRSGGRIRFADDKAYVTLKAESGMEGARHELEFEVSIEDGRLLEEHFATARIEKDRYVIPAGSGLKWEVDVFKGDNVPLVTAEIELPDTHSHFVKPSWLGADVTSLGQYTNAALAQRPYSQWSEAERAVAGNHISR